MCNSEKARMYVYAAHTLMVGTLSTSHCKHCLTNRNEKNQPTTS